MKARKREREKKEPERVRDRRDGGMEGLKMESLCGREREGERTIIVSGHLD